MEGSKTSSSKYVYQVVTDRPKNAAWHIYPSIVLHANEHLLQTTVLSICDLVGHWLLLLKKYLPPTRPFDGGVIVKFPIQLRLKI